MTYVRPAFLVAVALLLVGFRAPPEGAYEGLGSEAPEAILEDLEGRPARISEGSGTWSLLKFGTTWCPRCGQEVEEFNRLGSEFQKLGIRVVEIFLEDPPETVRSELKVRPRTYKGRVLIDRRGQCLALYGVSVIPRLLLVDPKGAVRLDSQFLEAAKLQLALTRAMQAP